MLVEDALFLFEYWAERPPLRELVAGVAQVLGVEFRRRVDPVEAEEPPEFEE